MILTMMRPSRAKKIGAAEAAPKPAKSKRSYRLLEAWINPSRSLGARARSIPVWQSALLNGAVGQG